MANLTLNYKIHTSTKYLYFSLQNGIFIVGFTQPIKILLTIMFLDLKKKHRVYKKLFFLKCFKFQDLESSDIPQKLFFLVEYLILCIQDKFLFNLLLKSKVIKGKPKLRILSDFVTLTEISLTISVTLRLIAFE